MLLKTNANIEQKNGKVQKGFALLHLAREQGSRSRKDAKQLARKTKLLDSSDNV